MKIRELIIVLILSGLASVSNFSAYGQISRWYEPGVAISNGVSFNDNYAQESAIWFRNGVRFLGSFCAIANLGYAHRSFGLDYFIPTVGEHHGPVFRDAFVLQLGIQARATNLRKIRKYMHPFLGFYFQRHFFSQDSGQRAVEEYLQAPKLIPREIVFEVGSDFLSSSFSKFFFSLQLEPFSATGTDFDGTMAIDRNEDAVDIYYHYKELPCWRIAVGIHF